MPKTPTGSSNRRNWQLSRLVAMLEEETSEPPTPATDGSTDRPPAAMATASNNVETDRPPAAMSRPRLKLVPVDPSILTLNPSAATPSADGLFPEEYFFEIDLFSEIPDERCETDEFV